MISPLPAPKKSVFEKQIFYLRSQSQSAKKMRGLFKALCTHRACPSPGANSASGAGRSGLACGRQGMSAEMTMAGFARCQFCKRRQAVGVCM